jgi:hypothetical protein
MITEADVEKQKRLLQLKLDKILDGVLESTVFEVQETVNSHMEALRRQAAEQEVDAFNDACDRVAILEQREG